MKRYTTARAREHFSDLLDAAQAGEAVIIERRGVRFALRAEDSHAETAYPSHRSVIAHVDAAIEAGQWTWSSGKEGLRFSSKGRARR